MILAEEVINMFEVDNNVKLLYESTVIERLIISHRTLSAQNKRMKEALEWYVDENNWRGYYIMGVWNDSGISNDEGFKAQEALKEVNP